jgi:hypothetical protein
MFPVACLAALLSFPWLVASARRAIRDLHHTSAVRAGHSQHVGCYLVAVTLFTGGILLHGWRPFP